MWQKSNETDFFIYQSFIFSNINIIPLQNSSLGQLHTDVPIFGSSAGSFQAVWSSECPLHPFGQFVLEEQTDMLKTIPVEDFQGCYQKWEQCLHRCVAAQVKYRLKEACNSCYYSTKHSCLLDFSQRI